MADGTEGLAQGRAGNYYITAVRKQSHFGERMRLSVTTPGQSAGSKIDACTVYWHWRATKKAARPSPILSEPRPVAGGASGPTPGWDTALTARRQALAQLPAPVLAHNDAVDRSLALPPEFGRAARAPRSVLTCGLPTNEAQYPKPSTDPSNGCSWVPVAAASLTARQRTDEITAV
jgi:hypothetical protein